jgi:hypothetical protein
MNKYRAGLMFSDFWRVTDLNFVRKMLSKPRKNGAYFKPNGLITGLSRRLNLYTFRQILGLSGFGEKLVSPALLA